MSGFAFITAVFAFLFCLGVPAPPAQDTGLDARIGQMIMVGFRGLSVTDDHPICRDIRERQIGGVVLFDFDVPTGSRERNIRSPEQLKALTASLQQRSRVPLWVAVDQEGGRVARLKSQNGFPESLSQKRLGKENDLNKTRVQAERTARTLAEEGINFNFAPVVDLDRNPANPVIGNLERGFSGNPAVVTRHARAVIAAHRRYGIFTSPKHFPGHGSSSADTHEGFVDVTQSWSAVELAPYKDLIQSGDADTIMTAHVYNEKIDPVWPATLSEKTLTGLLRQKLGFRGVVISDDMQMKAISERYGLETALKQAILAGVDILLFANNSVYEEDIAARAIASIRTLVERGEIPRARIDESYERIMAMKRRMPRQ